jgi:hypothetical protein
VAGRLARHGPVALVDLGLAGGGIEVLLGTEDAPGARWADLAQVRGDVTPEDLEGALPRWGDVEVLGPDRRGGHLVPAEAVHALGSALVAGGRSVVVDLPATALLAGRDVADVAGWIPPEGATVLVTSQDVLGVAGALAVLPRVPSDAGLVLRRRARGRVAPAEAARVLGLELRGVLAAEPGLAGAVERGLGPVVGRWSRVGRVADRVAAGAWSA